MAPPAAPSTATRAATSRRRAYDQPESDALAGVIERPEELLNETDNGENESPLTIQLAGLMENVQVAAREQVAYMVDMAKADALEMLGETKQGG